MGVEVAVECLSKSFGRQRIWQDVTVALRCQAPGLPRAEQVERRPAARQEVRVHDLVAVGILGIERDRCAVVLDAVTEVHVAGATALAPGELGDVIRALPCEPGADEEARRTATVDDARRA